MRKNIGTCKLTLTANRKITANLKLQYLLTCTGWVANSWDITLKPIFRHFKRIVAYRRDFFCVEVISLSLVLVTQWNTVRFATIRWLWETAVMRNTMELILWLVFCAITQKKSLRYVTAEMKTDYKDASWLCLSLYNRRGVAYIYPPYIAISRSFCIYIFLQNIKWYIKILYLQCTANVVSH